MAYVLDMTKAHKQSFIELVNSDNAATIQTPLTLAAVLIKNERVVDKAGEGIDRGFAVTLENAAYAPDTVEVFWNKVELADVMQMIISEDPSNDFNWYTPDNWDDQTSPADAIAAFKAAATRAGIDPDSTMENIGVTRRFDNTANRYFLDFTLTSMVFDHTVSFRMPRHFSEEVSVTKLNGFAYSPIQAADVVY